MQVIDAFTFSLVIRRLYECTQVNVPVGAKMNAAMYYVGISHYVCVGAGIVSEAPGFVKGVNK